KSRGPAKKAPVVSETDPSAVLNKLMDCPCAPLTLREVLGVSKELRMALQDAIKPRAVAKTLLSTTLESEDARISQGLIHLDVRIAGSSVLAIIDTGSQLNVMTE
ncbi:hypothetical protein GGG16DRAFT_23187, partial [Schizophyllum commune]